MAAKGKKSEELTSIPSEPTATILPPEKKTRKERSKINKAMTAEVFKNEPKAIAKKQAEEAEIINGRGRPSVYTEEIAAELLANLAMGQSLRTACRDDKMPNISTVFNWMRIIPGFSERYTQAKKEAADMMAEDIMDIADDAQNDYMEVTYGDQSILRTNMENIQRSRLRIETRKWLASKLQPTKYGDKLDVTSNGVQLPTPLLAGLVEANNTSDDIKKADSE